jgi:hypothetical protein
VAYFPSADVSIETLFVLRANPCIIETFENTNEPTKIKAKAFVTKLNCFLKNIIIFMAPSQRKKFGV